MTTFKQHLIKFAAPRLAELGYAYDDRLRTENWLYGFRKTLHDDVHSIVLFKRPWETRRSEVSFTVELVRCKTADPASWRLGHYEGFLQAPLSGLLFIRYKLKRYPDLEHWWTATGAERVAEQFADALDAITQYGIPWLEDPQSDMVEDPLRQHLTEYRAIVARVISTELMAAGYREVPSDLETTFRFERTLLPGILAWIEISLMYWPEKDVMFLGTRLLRTRDNGLRPRYGTGLYEPVGGSLEQLLLERTAQDVQREPFFPWAFRDVTELERKAADLAAHLKQRGIPWLENPRTTIWDS